jgi:hypothetical protein
MADRPLGMWGVYCGKIGSRVCIYRFLVDLDLPTPALTGSPHQSQFSSFGSFKAHFTMSRPNRCLAVAALLHRLAGLVDTTAGAMYSPGMPFVLQNIL